MIILEFKLKGAPGQYQALDEAIRTTQFIRNKCVRLWQDTWGTTGGDLNRYCRLLAQEYTFVQKLNSMARQAAAERAWAAINAALTILSRGLALLARAGHLPPGMAESHAWGEMSLYAEQVTVLCKASR